jgi:CheY-like chemotaxis protein
MTEAATAAPRILVLVAEDEALILDLIETVLEDGGFAVSRATDGDHAMAELNAHSDGIGALVTDIRLGGGASGWDVARHARELRQDLPVVYMSGDSAGDWSAQGAPHSLMISKPFAPAQIVTAVAQLLNQTPSH